MITMEQLDTGSERESILHATATSKTFCESLKFNCKGTVCNDHEEQFA
jgi:hypothetical protein